jgi:NADH-quinone oxidoreductase subunit A
MAARADFVTVVSRTVEPISPRFVRPLIAATFRVATQGGVPAVLDSWLPFLIYGLFAAAIPATMIAMSFALATRPRERTRERGTPFESGVSVGPLPEQRFTISFYLTAMLFIIFDIEIVFLYPLAVVLDQLAWFGFTELVVFIGILALGYVYIWRQGALEWR